MMGKSSSHSTPLRLISILLLIVSIIFVNECLEKERVEYSNAQSTLDIYASNQVCAAVNDTKHGHILSTQDTKEAKRRDMEVVHCGECGECSTSNDIEIMYRTKDTLTKTATKCTLDGLLFGNRAMEKCLENKVGFTPACSTCWSDNMRCTSAKCRFTCIKSVLSREPNNYDGNLNSCLECDEKLCGPAFLKCAGANRRRLGIVSDIIRDAEKEQCKINTVTRNE